jgi:hypothetical protein
LRECTTHFAPYGFRATWHHLVVSARIPVRLEDDLDSLTRAVDELEAARALVLPVVDAYAARRRAEKRAGRRVPDSRERLTSWGFCQTAFCPDPEVHPTEPLPVVIHRILNADADDRHCPACTTKVRLRRACPNCGVHQGGPGSRAHDRPADAAERWRRIWLRDLAWLWRNPVK